MEAQAILRAQELLHRSRMAGLDFIRLEIELLFSMLDSADTAAPRRRAQFLADAGRAAQTIQRLLPRLHIDDDERSDLRLRLAKVGRKYPAYRYLAESLSN